MPDIRLKKDNAKIELGGHKVLINVYKLLDLPGIFLYEKNGLWKVAHEASGEDLHEGYFANKKLAAVSVLLFMKDFNMVQDLSKLATNPTFKKALQKLDIAAKLKIKKGLQKFA
jgi:hypothetical protein